MKQMLNQFWKQESTLEQKKIQTHNLKLATEKRNLDSTDRGGTK